MSNIKKKYAEEVNYFKSSATSPDTWVDRAKKQIADIGGQVLGNARMESVTGGAFMFVFSLGDEIYRLNFPVMPVAKKGHEKAAIIQAATLLHNDIKHRCVMAKYLGVKGAFGEYLLLPNGKTVIENVEADINPAPLFMLGAGKPDVS